jgi:hypothetical protein
LWHLGQIPKAPNLSKGAGEEFTAKVLTGLQYVVDLPKTEAKAVMDAYQAQNHPGCSAVASTNPNGSKESSRLVGTVPLPKMTDQEVGSIEQITNDETSFVAYALLFRTAGRLEAIVIFPNAALSTTFGEGLSRMAESRLDASLSSR